MSLGALLIEVQREEGWGGEELASLCATWQGCGGEDARMRAGKCIV